MVSSTETGHKRLIANFDRLTHTAIRIGTDYVPSNPALTTDALQNSSANCKIAMEEVGMASLAYRNTVKEREIAFELIKPLTTRIVSTLKAYDKTGKSYEIASSYVRKLQGRRAKGKRTDEEKKADTDAGIVYKEVSASQMSYDNLVENFGMIVKLAINTPSYLPNEKDLKAESVNAVFEDLKSRNEAVMKATTNLFKARARRNELLYKEMTGLVDVALDVKAYLKGAFGSKSPHYKEVSSLLFRRLNRN
jgi:hypothetical protein